VEEEFKQKFAEMLIGKNDNIKALEEKFKSAITQSSIHEKSLREKTEDLKQERMKMSDLSEEVAQVIEKLKCVEKYSLEFRQAALKTTADLKAECEQKIIALDAQAEHLRKFKENKRESVEKVKTLQVKVQKLTEERIISMVTANEKESVFRELIQMLEEKLGAAEALDSAQKIQLCTNKREVKLSMEKVMKELKMYTEKVDMQAKTINALEARLQLQTKTAKLAETEWEQTRKVLQANIDALEVRLQQQTKTANVAKTEWGQTRRVLQANLKELRETVEKKTLEVKDLQNKIINSTEKLEEASISAHYHSMKIRTAENMKLEEDNHYLRSKTLMLESAITKVKAELDEAKSTIKVLKTTRPRCDEVNEQAQVFKSEKSLLEVKVMKMQAASNEYKGQISESEAAMECLYKDISTLKNETLMKDELVQRFRVQGKKNEER